MNPTPASFDSSFQRSLARPASWVIGCRIAGILATLTGNIVAARLLGPAEFGQYLFLTTVAACGSLIGVAGLNDAALRFLSENLALGRYSLAIAYMRRMAKLCAATTLLAACLIAAALGLFHVASGRLAQPALLIALTVIALVALAWQHLAGEVLRAWNDLRLASLFSGGISGGPVSNLLFLAGIGGLFATGVAVSSAAVLGLLGASVCLTAPVALYCVGRKIRQDSGVAAGPTVILSRTENRQLLAVAGTLLVLQLLAFVSQQLDIWIGEGLLPPDDLGLYGVAKRSMLMAAMPVQMAMLTIASGIPRLHAQNRRSELQELLRGSAGLAAVPSLGALALLVMFPEPLLNLVWGGSFGGAAPLVRILAIGNLGLILSGNPVHALSLTGLHHRALAVNLLAALIMAIGGPLAANRFGAAGLAWVSAAALTIQNALLWAFARGDLGVWTHARLPGRLGFSQTARENQSTMHNLAIVSPAGPIKRQPAANVAPPTT